MGPCTRPGFDGRPELRPVGGGDAESDRGAGGAESLARGEDDRDHGALALLTELIFEGLGHIADHTSECTSYFYSSPSLGCAAPGLRRRSLVGRPLPGPGRFHEPVSPFRRGGRAGPVLRPEGERPRATSHRRERAARCQSASDSASSEDSAAEKPSSASWSRRHSSRLSSMRISTLGTVTRRSVGGQSSSAAASATPGRGLGRNRSAEWASPAVSGRVTPGLQKPSWSPSRRCSRTSGETRWGLALDDFVDLENLRITREHDADVVQHRHEAFAERVELLPRVPDLADSELPVRNEGDVVLSSFGGQSPAFSRRRLVSSYCSGSHTRRAREADKDALVLRSSMLRVADSGMVVATRGLLRWIAPDRAALQTEHLYCGSLAWRARNLSQKNIWNGITLSSCAPADRGE